MLKSLILLQKPTGLNKSAPKYNTGGNILKKIWQNIRIKNICQVVHFCVAYNEAACVASRVEPSLASLNFKQKTPSAY
jgi:hypothetical protein